MTNGLISEIKGFSTHDGPGIRTTVFMKGCPLRCKWCCSPETWAQYPQVYFFLMKCKQCGRCIDSCSENAITLDEKRIIRNQCTLCMHCVEVCPNGALKIVGEVMSVEEVVKVIMQDVSFFNHSDGGVTLSGGEPLAQPKFTDELLKMCHSENIHTCLDTSGFADQHVFKLISQHADLILISIKHMDSKKHKQLTGVSNETILRNIRAIAKDHMVRISFPIIPGENDSTENIKKTAEFVESCGIQFVDLERFHILGQGKYEALGMDSPYDSIEGITEDKLSEVASIIGDYGLVTTIGRCIY